MYFLCIVYMYMHVHAHVQVYTKTREISEKDAHQLSIFHVNLFPFAANISPAQLALSAGLLVS